MNLVFQYYEECVQQISSSGTSLWIPIATSTIAIAAWIVSFSSLRSLRNAQSLIAKINLINVEVEMRKSYTEFKFLIYELEKSEDLNEYSILTNKKQTTLERYISMADKLAGLILYVKNIRQYKKVTDWKAEYSHIFDDVMITIRTEAGYNPDRINGLSMNVSKILAQWRTE